MRFKLDQTEKDKELSKVFGYPVASRVVIMQEGKEVGQVVSPSGSGGDTLNAIQVCGFTEAFDLWGCGVHQGYKDIQLLFDEGVMGGKFTHDFSDCLKCYRKPCQCETHEGCNPFTVKREKDLADRIVKVKK